MGERKSAADREHTGSYIGGFGLIAAGIGWANDIALLLVVGLVAAVIGGIMWGAGMARSDN